MNKVFQTYLSELRFALQNLDAAFAPVAQDEKRQREQLENEISQKISTRSKIIQRLRISTSNLFDSSEYKRVYLSECKKAQEIINQCLNNEKVIPEEMKSLKKENEKNEKTLIYLSDKVDDKNEERRILEGKIRRLRDKKGNRHLIVSTLWWLINDPIEKDLWQTSDELLSVRLEKRRIEDALYRQEKNNQEKKSQSFTVNVDSSDTESKRNDMFVYAKLEEKEKILSPKIDELQTRKQNRNIFLSLFLFLIGDPLVRLYNHTAKDLLVCYKKIRETENEYLKTQARIISDTHKIHDLNLHLNDSRRQLKAQRERYEELKNAIEITTVR